MLLEPAFVDTNAVSSANNSRQPLYFAQRNCSALNAEDASTLSQIGQAITNMTGFPVKCLSFLPVPVPSEINMSDQVYCGWLSSNCIVRYGSVYEVSYSESLMSSQPVQGFVSALYDWHDTDASLGRLKVSVWVNNSDIARDPSVPDVQRWSQAVNLAANAFLQQIAGNDFSARLIGVSDMPKGATHLSLDFSTLLGPLFMMWFFQMMLPVNVYLLVHEKELHLRVMQRMQGLRETAYYVVQYIWMLTLYLAFTVVFISFGSLIGLKFFILNSYTLQLTFYFLWGNLLTGFSFFFASWCSEARSAVLFSVVYVIITGFVANLVLVQYVEQGPRVISDVMELIPAFALFRGLYELAQYAFLADRNGGQGLVWSKLTNLDCGMLQVWLYLFMGSCIFPILGYYIEQVNGSGSGVRRHPLFFLGIRGINNKKCLKNKQTRLKNANQSWKLSWHPWRSRKREPVRNQDSLSQDQYAEVTSPLQSPLDYYYGHSSGASSAGNLRQYYGEVGQMPSQFAIAEEEATTITKKSCKQATVRDLDTGDKQPHLDDVPLRTDEEYTLSGSSCQAGENMDVWRERQRVEMLYRAWEGDPRDEPPAAIILRRLRKVYPQRNQNQQKIAIHDLSLSVQHCECFGLLGPNGAGKTTTLRIMEGFIDPSSGAAIIEGLSIPADINQVYSLTGACPQHDLLWDALTGREHLLFYGRIKNLNGLNLKKSVDSTLRSVNLFDVQDYLVSTYSGGMKRRLSVAIALMGDPLVVYLDEPTTGLDPSSRRLLWEVIREAREDKALVLTTHSMEEAEALCDRLGIFVNGRLECIGNPKELTARYGGYLSFSLTTPLHQEATAAGIIKSMVPGAKLVYSLGGTQKYELPLEQITIDDVFRRMEEVKYRKELEILDWGVSNATLEEVFIKITRDAGVRMEASE